MSDEINVVVVVDYEDIDITISNLTVEEKDDEAFITYDCDYQDGLNDVMVHQAANNFIINALKRSIEIEKDSYTPMA